MRIRIGMLLRHPPIHQRTRTSRTTKMLHIRRPRMADLPASQLNQRLILLRLLSLKTIHPCQPPIPAFTFLISTNITLVALDISHRPLLLPLTLPYPTFSFPYFPPSIGAAPGHTPSSKGSPQMYYTNQCIFSTIPPL